MVHPREADPFDALVTQGVTAQEPDPSAEPTVVNSLGGLDAVTVGPAPGEEEVVWLPPREEAAAPPAPTPPVDVQAAPPAPTPIHEPVAEEAAAPAAAPVSEPVAVEAAAPAPAPVSEPELELVLPPPWWMQKVAWVSAAGVVLLGVIVAAVIALSPSPAAEPAVVPPPAPPVVARPTAAPRRVEAPAAAAPAPAPAAATPAPSKPKRAARPAEPSGGFAEWPGEKRQPAPPPPARREALKRPSF